MFESEVGGQQQVQVGRVVEQLEQRHSAQPDALVEDQPTCCAISSLYDLAAERHILAHDDLNWIVVRHAQADEWNQILLRICDCQQVVQCEH